ncbi:hypothetical protein K458DRAFT_11781 [Lentithecium fluviatile CBS 122367]|uniref:Uncharacterized protein n=1 Tax=Lentithecium fluviatile CBS 122367 TaxID=1168545 RepID=A0A6G1JQ14_9PLEO|nr:hypothetical protein K458DRAFT_11781 [Lentithecium fluviatile CBS 122367]
MLRRVEWVGGGDEAATRPVRGGRLAISSPTRLRAKVGPFEQPAAPGLALRSVELRNGLPRHHNAAVETRPGQTAAGHRRAAEGDDESALHMVGPRAIRIRSGHTKQECFGQPRAPGRWCRTGTQARVSPAATEPAAQAWAERERAGRRARRSLDGQQRSRGGQLTHPTGAS